MRHPSRKTRKIGAAVATPLAILIAAGTVWHASYAAFSGSTRNSGNSWSTGSVALTDDDAGSARFQATNLVPDQTETKCIAVTANATVSGTVKGYAVNPVTSPQRLEDHILISIRTGLGGGFSSCTGFVADGTLASNVPLSTMALAHDYATGLGGWAVSPGTQTRTYEISWKFDTTGLTQSQLDQLQGAQTGIDIQWELQSD